MSLLDCHIQLIPFGNVTGLCDAQMTDGALYLVCLQKRLSEGHPYQCSRHDPICSRPKGNENEGCHALTLSEIGCSSQTNLSAGLLGLGLQAHVGLTLCFLMPLGLD